MKKLNIIELLHDCPTGMELDCTIFEDVYFDSISDCGKFIYCYINHEDHKTSISFNKYGAYSNIDKSKCVIFPKGKTSWEDFHRPFKDGDIVTYEYENGLVSMILKKFVNFVEIHHHCALYDNAKGFVTNNYIVGEPKYTYFATEEEKAKLFQAIKDNGYKWDTETKTLDNLVEPIFRIGDRIRHKTHIRQGNAVTAIKDTHYILDDKSALPFVFQDEYELVPNKFDITTLKPFDKVLYRMHHNDTWLAGFYNVRIKNKIFVIGLRAVPYCIPYEKNEHLLGATADCDEFYKTWKK